ncbi:MAG: hypothetical protein ACRCUS_01305 [Anaerovoracaceae bacterium]
MRIYISGKITGLDKLRATQKFNRTEIKLWKEYGDEVSTINPAILQME